MSRIGNQAIILPTSVTLSRNGNVIEISGPLGKLSKSVSPSIDIKQEGENVTFSRRSNIPSERALHGLTRALVANMVEGITKGFEKHLELVGTGYRVTATGNGITLNLGLSHPVEFVTPTGITLTVEGNNKIHLKGNDKEQLGQFAANIRAARPPEVYKGKGVRYQGEVVRRKAGKAAKVGAKA